MKILDQLPKEGLLPRDLEMARESEGLMVFRSNLGWLDQVQRLGQLPTQGRRNLVVDAIDPRPTAWEPSRAENAVDQRKDKREIMVSMFVVGMMPVVEGG